MYSRKGTVLFIVRRKGTVLFVVRRGWNGGEVIKERIARGKGGGEGKEQGRGLMPSRVFLWPIINGIYIHEAHVLSNERNLVVVHRVRDGRHVNVNICAWTCMYARERASYRSRKRDVTSFLDIKHLNS